ncbi:pilus assembly protein CpaF [Anaeromicropila populeti]|uniref:Pilus assembly protein CpaF n=1 Tax=Anaeromicropila populeti TaxID=37658 RepID=A0A1I6LCZ5_9FIRM|nr:pilus assembly protein CpaF [Anaeromicropila populeti]
MSRKNILMEVKNKVLKQLDLSINMADEQVLDLISSVIYDLSKEIYIGLQSGNKIKNYVFYSLRRLDVLQELVEDQEITEIMVNGSKHIFIEKNGRITKTELTFESSQKLEDVIQKIVSSANRIVNESSPIVDTRLIDGSRVNVILKPVAVNGPVMTIRKFPLESITMEQLVEIGSLSQEVCEFLKNLVVSKYNIFISGGTGSGKTTFLNALSNFIPSDERIITIEDSCELQINHNPNLVTLEARNANVDGRNEVSIRDLIKAALRARPDRIIVGEVRDAAAIDMLSAFNTGHDGSLSTGHANAVKDMLT